MLFFELLQIAIGNRSQLSHTPTAEEWREICALAKKQAMVGIAFCGVEQLPVEQRPPRKLWMQWYTAAERIKGLNAEMDRKVFKVARMFRREGFQGVVLKGQGMAQLYKVERSTVKRSSLAEGKSNSQQSTDGLFNQRDKHTNLDASTHTQACAGHPDESFDLTQTTQNSQNISVNANIDANLDSNSQKTHCFARVSHPDDGFDFTQKAQNNCQGQGQQTTVNGQRTDHPDGIIQHSTFNGNNLTQTSQKTQNLHDASPVRLPYETLDLTQTSQKTQTLHDASPVRHPDETLDLTQTSQNTQTLHDAAPVRHPDEVLSLTQNSQNTQNIISSQDKQSDLDLNSQNARIASLACAHPDGTVDCRPLTVDSNSLTVDTCLGTKQVELRSIKEYRTPGDIDIWLHGDRGAILEYVRWHVPDCKPVYHHVDFPVVDDVSIEVHFTPTWMNSPIRNRRLQRFFKSMVNGQRTDHPDGIIQHSTFNGNNLTQKSQNTQKNIISQDKQSTLDENSQNLHDASPVRLPDETLDLTQTSQNTQTLHDASPVRLPDEGFDLTQKAQKAQNARIASLACGHPDGTVDRRPLTVDCCLSTVDTCLDSKQATFPVPNAAFNRVYILVHIYRHLFAEGIGLRQLLDYYFVLRQGFTESEREETLRILRSLGMMRFTRAVMWMLQEVFGMPDRYLLTSPDAKEGRFLLDEIMLAGNFGKYDERMQRGVGEGTFRWGLRKVLRNFRFVRSYPSEVLWSPIFKVWHLFWRIRHA